MSVTVVNMPKRRSDSDFTDYQVLTMIRANPDLNLYQLYKNCGSQMKGDWTIGKVQGAVDRLESKGRIISSTSIEGGRACRKLCSV